MRYFLKIGFVALMLVAVASCGNDDDGASVGSYIILPPAVPDSDLIARVSAGITETEEVDFKELPLRKNLVHIVDSGAYSVSLNFYVVVFAAYSQHGQGLCAISPNICLYNAADSLLKTMHDAGTLSINTSLALQDKSNEKTERKLVALSDTVDVARDGAYVSIAISSNLMRAYGGTSYYSGLGYACAYIEQNADNRKVTVKKLP